MLGQHTHLGTVLASSDGTSCQNGPVLMVNKMVERGGLRLGQEAGSVYCFLSCITFIYSGTLFFHDETRRTLRVRSIPFIILNLTVLTERLLVDGHYSVLDGCICFPVMYQHCLSASFRNVQSSFSDTLPLSMYFGHLLLFNLLLYWQSTLIIMYVI